MWLSTCVIIIICFKFFLKIKIKQNFNKTNKQQHRMKICSFPKPSYFLGNIFRCKNYYFRYLWSSKLNNETMKQPYVCVLFYYLFCANHFMYKFITSKVRTLLCLEVCTILCVIIPATRLWPVMITICSATLNTLVLWNHHCSWGDQCLWLSWITLALEFTSQRMYIQAFV